MRTKGGEGLREGGPSFRIQRLFLAGRCFIATGEPQDIFRRALDDKQPLSIGFGEDRDATPLEIER